MSNNNLSRPLFRFQGLHPLFKPRRGFTLIELLIVVAIISILVAIGLAAFTTAQRSGRDSQRQADVGDVGGVLEQYFAENGSYPSSDPTGKIVCTSPPSVFDWGTDAFNCGGNVFITQLPADPSPGQPQYFYRPCKAPPSYSDRHQSFTIFTSLERAPSTPPPTPRCPPTPGGYNYWVDSPQ